MTNAKAYMKTITKNGHERGRGGTLQLRAPEMIHPAKMTLPPVAVTHLQALIISAQGHAQTISARTSISKATLFTECRRVDAHDVALVLYAQLGQSMMRSSLRPNLNKPVLKGEFQSAFHERYVRIHWRHAWIYIDRPDRFTEFVHDARKS